MDAHPHDDHDALAARTTRVIAHLDGALDEHMLATMTGTWSMLEHAATDAPAHARAVRARLFWESLSPGGVAAAPTSIVHELEPSWHDDEHESSDLLDADAA